MRLFFNLYPKGTNISITGDRPWASNPYPTREKALEGRSIGVESHTVEVDLSEQERAMCNDGYKHYGLILSKLPSGSGFLVKNRAGEFFLAPGEGTTPKREEAYTFTSEEQLFNYDRELLEDGKLEKIPVQLAESAVAPAALDQVTVGDLDSNARGTGARKSAGKPDWSQFPWWVMRPIFDAWKANDIRNSGTGVLGVIELMAEWQRGKNESLDLAAALLLEIIYAPAGRSLSDKTSGDWFPARGFESTVRVLEFGERKYKKGNWARGMPWTVVFNSCMSHLTKMFQGEENDHESGLPHSAHAMCNIVFLLGYRDLFPEGDDRQPEFRFGGTAPEVQS